MRDVSKHLDPLAVATNASSRPAIVDRATWQAELDMLRVREKAHTRAGDAIAAARRRLPKVEVDKLFDSRTRYGVRSKAVPAPGCPTTAEDAPAGAAAGGEERFYVTRSELIAMVEEAVRVREEKR